VDALAEGRRADLYLLTGDEIPFVQDGLRDGEDVRHGMHEAFARELEESGRAWALMRGTPEDRKAQAVGLVDALLKGPVRPRGEDYGVKM
jgi:HTH-type transcriptional repressor of NAD biosynthesis genes